jgi:hypothetical protein
MNNEGTAIAGHSSESHDRLPNNAYSRQPIKAGIDHTMATNNYFLWLRFTSFRKIRAPQAGSLRTHADSVPLLRK